MANQKPKLTPAKTPEQIRAERIRFFAEKRETFAINILINLCRREWSDIDRQGLVKASVEMADQLMEELYAPKPKEEKKEEKAE